jgi:uncharacterized protein
MDIIDFRTRPRTQYYYRHIVPKPIKAYEQYFSMYHMDERLKLGPLEDSVEEMTGSGVARGVIFAGDFEGCKQVYEDTKLFPDVFIPLASVDIRQGITKGMTDLEYAYCDFNFRGMTLSPFVTGIYPTDSRYFPLYALSEKLGRVVHIHSSTHFNPDIPMDIGNPDQLDKVAMNFQGLKLVLGHAGMGFGTLGLGVAQRHNNMFIDFTGLRPRYLPREMVHAINTYLSRKAIFGTNYPSLPHSIIEEWKEVIKPEVAPYFFAKNAARALGLDR